jgi:hypothetical protein
VTLQAAQIGAAVFSTATLIFQFFRPRFFAVKCSPMFSPELAYVSPSSLLASSEQPRAGRKLLWGSAKTPFCGCSMYFPWSCFGLSLYIFHHHNETNSLFWKHLDQIDFEISNTFIACPY